MTDVERVSNSVSCKTSAQGDGHGKIKIQKHLTPPTSINNSVSIPIDIFFLGVVNGCGYFLAVLIWFRWTRKADVNSTSQTTQPQGRNQRDNNQKKNERTKRKE
jgi:hypothetical protein